MKNKILELFTKNHSLKFNEIEKYLSQRSNKLAYHLKNLVKKQILKKENQTYSLSDSSEYLIPYLSNKNATIPVILIHIGDNKNAFLYKRTKRPYISKLSLPGGRLIKGESIFQASIRIAKEKCNLDIIPEYISSITLEHAIKNKNKIMHSFLLILVKSKTKDRVIFTNIQKNKKKIISSDYNLISSLPIQKINIPSVFTKE